MAPMMTSKIETGDEVTSKRTWSGDGTSSATPLRCGLLSLAHRQMSGSEGFFPNAQAQMGRCKKPQKGIRSATTWFVDPFRLALALAIVGGRING